MIFDGLGCLVIPPSATCVKSPNKQFRGKSVGASKICVYSASVMHLELKARNGRCGGDKHDSDKQAAKLRLGTP